jgi:hypothetical protein
MKRNNDFLGGLGATEPIAKSLQLAGDAPALQFGVRTFYPQ